jgi:hypothetical protein
MKRDDYPKDRTRFDRRALEEKSVTEIKPLLEKVVNTYFSWFRKRDTKGGEKAAEALHELMLESRKLLRKKL